MKQIRMIMKIMQVILTVSCGAGFILHGVMISNVGECLIGIALSILSYMLVKDNEYDKSLKEVLMKKNN